jgi:hypothetical protein
MRFWGFLRVLVIIFVVLESVSMKFWCLFRAFVFELAVIFSSFGFFPATRIAIFRNFSPNIAVFIYNFYYNLVFLSIFTFFRPFSLILYLFLSILIIFRHFSTVFSSFFNRFFIVFNRFLPFFYRFSLIFGCFYNKLPISSHFAHFYNHSAYLSNFVEKKKKKKKKKKKTAHFQSIFARFRSFFVHFRPFFAHFHSFSTHFPLILPIFTYFSAYFYPQLELFSGDYAFVSDPADFVIDSTDLLGCVFERCLLMEKPPILLEEKGSMRNRSAAVCVFLGRMERK